MSRYRDESPGAEPPETGSERRTYLSAPPFHVGRWLVDPPALSLVDGDEVVRLGPRIMDSLLLLAGKPGEVVTRKRFMERVWSDSVVGDDTLSMAISDLRRTLGDDPDRPEFIETIRNAGYRLIAPVVPAEEATPGPAADTPGGDARSFPRRGAYLILGVGLLLAVTFFVSRSAMFGEASSPPAGNHPILSGRPLTSYPSSEIHAALSPSGREVAFAWAGDETQGLDIYVKPLDSDPPSRLTEIDGREFFPSWSPDGGSIAFVHVRDVAPYGSDIMTVPATGGPLRTLVESDRRITGLDWSTDGQLLALSMPPSRNRRSVLHLFEIESRSLEPMDITAPELAGSRTPAFSPDGRELAFIGIDEAGLEDVYVVSVSGGAAKRLTTGQREVFGLAWSCEGTHVVFAAIPNQYYEMWKVDRNDRTMTWLPTRGDKVMYPSINCARNLLAYEETSCDLDVWRIGLDRPGTIDSEMRPIISSTREDYNARYSRDGRRIVFTSTRSGRPQIWACDADGSDPIQLTHTTEIHPRRPGWSPDGLRIGFTGLREGINSVFVMDGAGGSPRCLSGRSRHELFAGWSTDGQWIYFIRIAGPQRGLWRMRPAGSDRQLVVADARTLVADADTSMGLVYFRHDQPGLWRRDISGGQEVLLIPAESLVNWRGIAVTKTGAYFTRVTGNRSDLYFLDFATGEESYLNQLDLRSCNRLSLSPDQDFLVFDGYDRLTCDLYLVPDFH